jgi:hypothetical protein
MVARKARRSRGQEPVQGSGSRSESARGFCGSSPQNRRVTWLSHRTKSGGSADGDEIRECQEASMPGDTQRDRGACVGRARTAAKAWLPDEQYKVFTILIPRVCIFLSCNKGSFVFRLPPYKPSGERMADASWNPSSFAFLLFPIFPLSFP